MRIKSTLLSILCIQTWFFCGCPSSSPVPTGELSEIKAQQAQFQQKLNEMQTDVQVKIARLEERVKMLETASALSNESTVKSELGKETESSQPEPAESLPSPAKTESRSAKPTEVAKKIQEPPAKPEQVEPKSETKPITPPAHSLPNRSTLETEMVHAIGELTAAEAKFRTAQAAFDQVSQQDPNDPQVAEKIKQAQAELTQAQTAVNVARQQKHQAEERLQQGK